MTRSRTFWTRLAAFALAGVLIGALAAFLVRGGGDSAPGEANALTPSPTSPALATDRPTTEATPRPSASDAPTPPPTAKPSAVGSRRPSLSAFVKHVSAAIKDGQALLPPLQQAAQAFDIKATKGAASAISDWAETERSWLDSHSPRPCYAVMHETYAGAIDDFAEAAAITEKFAEDFPFADYDSLQHALDLAESGAGSMQGAVDQLSSVRC